MNEFLNSPATTREPAWEVNKNIPEAAQNQPATPENDLPFGQALRALRLEQKLSVAAIALKCGLSASAINKIEQGRFKPSRPVAAKIDELLGSDLLARFGGQLRGGFVDELDLGGREPESNSAAAVADPGGRGRTLAGIADPGDKEPESGTVAAVNKLSLNRKNLKHGLEVQPDIKAAPPPTRLPEFATAKPQLDVVLEIMSQTTEAVLRLTKNLDSVIHFLRAGGHETDG